MSSTGQQVVAGRIPGERIATQERDTAVTGITTTETVTDSVTAILEQGRVYSVSVSTPSQSDTAGDTALVALKEDNTAGTRHQVSNVDYTTANVGYITALYTEYEATADGNKTFVATLDRTSGSGTLDSNAFGTQKAYLFVNYIRG